MEYFQFLNWGDTDNDTSDDGQLWFGPAVYHPAIREVDTSQDAHMQSKPEEKVIESTETQEPEQNPPMKNGKKRARSEPTLPPSIPQPQPDNRRPANPGTALPPSAPQTQPGDLSNDERTHHQDSLVRHCGLPPASSYAQRPKRSDAGDINPPVKRPRGRPRKHPQPGANLSTQINPQVLINANGNLPPPPPVPDASRWLNGHESQNMITNAQNTHRRPFSPTAPMPFMPPLPPGPFDLQRPGREQATGGLPPSASKLEQQRNLAFYSQGFQQRFDCSNPHLNPGAHGPGAPVRNGRPIDYRAVARMHYFMEMQEKAIERRIMEAEDTLRQVPEKHDDLTDEEVAMAKSLFRSDVEWNDLSWGVKWVILWILNKTDRFAKIVTLILHLGHRQVHEFIEQYIRQHLFWETWKENVERIPHAALLQYALEKRQTVAELLQQYRPLLYTEQMTQQDEEKGADFLLSLGRPGVLEEFKAFTNEKLSGFLRLDIEWDFIQEVIDKQQILASVGLRWLNPEGVGKVIMRSLPQEDSKPKSGLRNPFTKITLFGPTNDDGQDSDMSESKPTDNDQTSHISKQPVDPEATDKEADPESLLCPETPLLSLIPEPHGLMAIPAHQQLLRIAIHRTAPESYGIVQGTYASNLVSTHLEEERGLLPVHSSYRPKGFPFYAKHVPGIIGFSDEDPVGEVFGGTMSQDEGLTEQQLMRHDALCARGRAFTQIAESGQFSPGLQTVGRPQDGRNETGYYRESGLNRVVNAPSVEYTVSVPSPGQLHERDEPPTPSKQLRQMLEKYNGFLTKNNQEEKSSSSDSDDEAAMDISDIPLPEPEKDEEYCPKKKSSRKPPRKKATSTRKVGRPRKPAVRKNDNVTPKKVEGLQGHGGQADTGSGESSMQASFDAQKKTPTKDHTGDNTPSSGPPSSGRIELTIRPSQTPTPTEPSNPELEVTIPRQDHATPTRAPIPRSKHAVSARYATYASVSTHARFAQTAIRSAKRGVDATTTGTPNNIVDPNKLTLEFSKIKRCGKQYADRAEFAWKAERAEYAGAAFEADYALHILGQGTSE
ncbi:unnamed protein product [Fusarium venenatum]|uniref:Uncharacterized protein n=2 Tax=Fusarium venenatum TaxID=56646 RepID=A0A2L2T6Q6_9HYPO|nr:uncharacterized protein FVRRES_13820 [Fusarium venenatum]CEI41952.1 unnamed protein product [Fusarium venenatum]